MTGVLQSAASQQHLIHGHWHCPGLRLACNAQADLSGHRWSITKEGAVASADELHCLHVKAMFVAQQHDQGNMHP